MYFDNKTVTYAGATLMAHSDAIQKATVIDSVIISSNTPSNSVDYATLSFGDFGNYKEFPVTNVRQKDNTFQPEALISNDNMSQPYPVTMVGLKGHTDGESTNVLIAVSVDNSDTPFTIPAATNVPYKLYLDIPIAYSNSSNVKMNVANAGLVTTDDVNEMITIAINNANELAKSYADSAYSHASSDLSAYSLANSSALGSVSSAIANNSGITNEFSSVNVALSANSSANANLATQVTANTTGLQSLANDESTKEYTTSHNADVSSLNANYTALNNIVNTTLARQQSLISQMITYNHLTGVNDLINILSNIKYSLLVPLKTVSDIVAFYNCTTQQILLIGMVRQSSAQANWNVTSVDLTLIQQITGKTVTNVDGGYGYIPGGVSAGFITTISSNTLYLYKDESLATGDRYVGCYVNVTLQ